MRFLVCVIALGVLGCAFGPSAEPPPPATPPPAPSALSQALGGMGVTASDAAAPNTPAAPPTAPDVTQGAAAAVTTARDVPSSALPASAVPSPAVPSPAASSPACAEANAARDAVRARLAEMRLTLGAETSARLESAGQAMMTCDSDPACLRDGKARMARIEAYDRAKAAHEAERTRLAQAEVGLYDADRAVVAACGAP